MIFLKLCLHLCYRAGGALAKPLDFERLPIVGVDEAVYGSEPEQPVDEVDPPEFPNPLVVKSEDDLIGIRACIAYEDSLRQLATFLQLPIQRCMHSDPITMTVCNCCPPFHVQQKTRGTSIIIEWVSFSSKISDALLLTYGHGPPTILMLSFFYS